MTKAPDKYTLLHHTADTGIEVTGESLAKLFENAATGLFALITDVEKVQPRERIRITIPRQDPEEMLRFWLENLLQHFNMEAWLFSRFRIDMKNGTQCLGTARGEHYDPSKHDIYTEIKGITYHCFEVKQHNRKWIARFILDV
ncbi:MAG: archease [FCB group bacterium]|nr:archease [FCB group bacterium]